MDLQSAQQQALKRSSNNQKRRERGRRDTLIFQSLGMTQAQWRTLPQTERTAFRLAWVTEQEETQTCPTKSPGYVYVLRHPRYADLCKVGETINPQRRLRHYNTSCPYKEYRFNYLFRTDYVREVIYPFYDSNHELRLHGEWFQLTPEEASVQLRTLKAELCS